MCRQAFGAQGYMYRARALDLGQVRMTATHVKVSYTPSIPQVAIVVIITGPLSGYTYV